VVRPYVEEFKEKGVVDRVRSAFDIAPKVGQTHVDALEAAAMSLDEYRFHTDELYLVLRENAARPADQRDPGLNEIYGAYLKFRERVSALQGSERGGEPVDLLEETAAGRLTVPEANRALVIQNRPAALETVEAFLLDTGLRSFRKLLREVEQRSNAPATPAPADVEKK